jgi:AbiJ N-terminal domain 3/Abortive infection C-terminus
MGNLISEVTRRNIFDELRLRQVSWSGRLGECEFLSRVFDLKSLPSHDRRCANMADDVHFHRQHFYDGADDWIFDDARLDLLCCPDDVLLNFLCEMIHPVVRQDAEECEALQRSFNVHLAADGFEIVPHRHISKHPIFAGRRILNIGDAVPATARAAADELDSAHIAAQVTRMETSVMNDPPLAIGSAKEFIESICKGILSRRKVPRTGAEDLQRLVKMTREALAMESDDPNGPVRKVVNGLATVVQGVTELRGLHGTGHGPEPDAKMPEPVLARLVVASAVALGVFLLDIHQRAPARERERAE